MDIPGQAVKLASGTSLEQVLKMLKYCPDQLEQMGRAGSTLKDAREVAGLSLTELSSAVDLKNPDLLKAVEDGTAGLPFEILLRLASSQTAFEMALHFVAEQEKIALGDDEGEDDEDETEDRV
jgi:DNA mismatch repair protein MutH